MKTVISDKETLRVLFCRPNPNEWEVFQKNENKTFHEGIVQKISGLLRRKSPRFMYLSRKSLTLQKQQNDTKVFQVSKLTLSVATAPVVLNQPKSSFNLLINKSEYEFDCGDARSCVLWQHHIHSSVKDVFKQSLPKFYLFNSVTEAQQTSSKSNGSPKKQVSRQTKKKVNNPANNPYSMLWLSSITVNSTGAKAQLATENVISDEDLQILLKKRIELPSFELEREVLKL